MDDENRAGQEEQPEYKDSPVLDCADNVVKTVGLLASLWALMKKLFFVK
jgi:hypothetical protein